MAYFVISVKKVVVTVNADCVQDNEEISVIILVPILDLGER